MTICKVDGCGRKHEARGYCERHYAQLRRYGKVLDRTVFDLNEIKIKGDVAEIVLYSHKQPIREVARAIIDAEDVEKVKPYKWYLSGDGYVKSRDRKSEKQIYLHRLILNPDSNELTDHKDQNRLHNYKSNLRPCSNSQNCMNRGLNKNNASGYKGVYWHKQRKRWCAQIIVNYKQIHLGIFISKLDAAEAYNKASWQYHGEFGYQNKIERTIK